MHLRFILQAYYSSDKVPWMWSYGYIHVVADIADDIWDIGYVGWMQFLYCIKDFSHNLCTCMVCTV